jgi:hypothetical protein
VRQHGLQLVRSEPQAGGRRQQNHGPQPADHARHIDQCGESKPDVAVHVQPSLQVLQLPDPHDLHGLRGRPGQMSGGEPRTRRPHRSGGHADYPGKNQPWQKHHRVFREKRADGRRRGRMCSCGGDSQQRIHDGSHVEAQCERRECEGRNGQGQGEGTTTHDVPGVRTKLNTTMPECQPRQDRYSRDLPHRMEQRPAEWFHPGLSLECAAEDHRCLFS